MGLGTISPFNSNSQGGPQRMIRTKVRDVLTMKTVSGNVLVKGWIRTIRSSKNFSFIELNDGSCLKNIQIIADETLKNYSDIESLTTGSSISASGKIVPSLGKGQDMEIQADDIFVFQKAPDSYPLQKKRHSDEYLRTIAHLRPRSNKYGAMFRIRSQVSILIHDFFQKKGFYYIHTPIITGSDCEGAGELFRVSNLNPENISYNEGKADYSTDFSAKKQISPYLASFLLKCSPCLWEMYTPLVPHSGLKTQIPAVTRRNSG